MALNDAHPLQQVVDRQDEEIKQLRKTNKEKDEELKNLRDQGSITSKKSERYWTASIFLFIGVVACVGLIANRQWELNAAIQEKNTCNKEVVDLKKKTGECGPEQLKELKSCRAELKNLTEVKGKCLVYEKNIQEANSKAVVKQGDDLMELLSKREDLVAKEAERKESCEKHLREVEVEARRLVNQITVLVQEKEQLNSTYKSCAEQLGACLKQKP